MEKNYVDILIQSLEQKLKVLESVSEENHRQKQLLQEEELDMDAFQGSMEHKSELIEQISFLDDGFEKMYDRVKVPLQSQKEAYLKEISALKELVGKITEKTVAVQKEEWANRALAEVHFSSMHQKVRQVKNSKQVANKYYNNMAKLNYVDPQFMDRKK